MQTKVGVRNILICLNFLMSIANKFDDALEDDQRVDWVEISTLGPDLLKIPNFIEAIKNVPAEFNDLDDSEKQEIKANIAEKFDLSNEKTEQAIEYSFQFGIEIAVYALRMKTVMAA